MGEGVTLVLGIESRQAEDGVPMKEQPDVPCGSPSQGRRVSVREQSPVWAMDLIVSRLMVIPS